MKRIGHGLVDFVALFRAFFVVWHLSVSGDICDRVIFFGCRAELLNCGMEACATMK